MLTFSKARRECDKTLTGGLVFAHPSRLKTIFRLGRLVLMDATYHTNEFNWQLYSLLCAMNLVSGAPQKRIDGDRQAIMKRSQ